MANRPFVFEAQRSWHSGKPPKNRAAVAIVRSDPFPNHEWPRIAAVAAEVTRLKLKGLKTRKKMAQGKRDLSGLCKARAPPNPPEENGEPRMNTD